MQCPKCGSVQPDGRLDCAGCGVVFSKFRGSGARPPAPAPEAPAVTNPYSAPIRTSLRVVRTAAGVLAVGFGGWLFLLGQEMTLSPFNVILLIGYACVGLFWVLSATLPVTVRQFAMEMLLCAASTVLLVVTLPEAFDTGKLSNVESGPMYGGQPPAAPAALLASLEKSLGAVCREARNVLDAPGDEKLRASLATALDDVRQGFRHLGKTERERAEGAYKAAVALEERVKAAKPGAAPEVEGAYAAVEALEREVAALDAGLAAPSR